MVEAAAAEQTPKIPEFVEESRSWSPELPPKNGGTASIAANSRKYLRHLSPCVTQPLIRCELLTG